MAPECPLIASDGVRPPKRVDPRRWIPGAVQMLGASALHVRRTGLELGGKGALIVLEDAPTTALVDWAMMGIFLTSGQVCCATSRLLVHVSRKDEVLEALRASAAAVRMGDPLDETTQMGAVITEEAASRLVGAVAQARAEGSILVCGGGRVAAEVLPAALAGGYYVQPTVLADVPRSSAAWQLELFGPVLCVQSFESEAQAVALANDSPYGLAHAVLSADPERCERVGAQLEAGTVWLNCNQVRGRMTSDDL